MASGAGLGQWFSRVRGHDRFADNAMLFGITQVRLVRRIEELGDLLRRNSERSVVVKRRTAKDQADETAVLIEDPSAAVSESNPNIDLETST